LSRQESLLKSSVSVVGLNVLTSLMAGLAIFPAIFALGMEPQEGPGLLFSTLPALFEKLPFGGLFIVLFLVLFLFAALTSAFSMLEILVSEMSYNDQQRSRMSWLFGILIFIVGIPSALSFGVWSDVHIFGLSLFDAADFAVTNVLMPIGVLLIASFVGYRFPRQRLYEELATSAPWWRKSLTLYILLLRYVIPVVIVIVFLHVLGLLRL
jgi:NSS family neurotransmitter:Na+ symporter